MIDNLQQYWEAEEKAEKLTEILLKTARGTEYDSRKEDVVSRLEAAEEMLGRKFVILVCGLLKSGKSSIINSLIGEDLLDEAILPTAPSLYELHYGQEKKIIAYKWVKGHWDESRPVYVKPTPEGIKEYKEKLPVTAFLGQEDIENSMCKMVICWPIELLKTGLMFVETPDTSYLPPCQPIKEYLPYADAVIYSLSMSNPCSNRDMEYLREINDLAVDRIVSVFTRCGLLNDAEPDENDFQDNPEYDMEEIRQNMAQIVLGYSSLGAEAIHFVEKQGDGGKTVIQDAEVMRQSGYPELKEYLNRMLIQKRGVLLFTRCIKLLNEAVRDMNRSEVFSKYITPDIKKQLQSLWTELPLSGEMVDQGFQILDQVIPSLEPELAKRYGRQKRELYDKYQDPVLHLAVIGNYSCGKSTFLNAILKQELLSMDNLPTTALPTYIRWDKVEKGEPEMIAEDIGGERYNLCGPEKNRFEIKTGLTLPKETGAVIDSLTTNSALIGKIKRIELSFPKEEQYENFCIIDTPGVNPGQEDAREHILETQSILRKYADAAIVLFPALQVYTADFQDFLLKNAAHLMDDSIFIITKMDMVRRESERAKLLNYVKKLLQKNFELQDPEVYGISAGYALDYYMDETAYSEDKQWAVGFEKVMDKVFQKLRDRRQEIISNRISVMVQELIHVVGEEVKNDTKRLEEDQEKLIKYSLKNLMDTYCILAYEYQKDLLLQKQQWILTSNAIVESNVTKAQKKIIDGIGRQMRLKGLREYLDGELEETISDMNSDIAQAVNDNVTKDIRNRGYRFLEDVKSCLEEYQYYVASAGNFFDKQKKDPRYPVPEPVNIPMEPPDQLSYFLETVLNNASLVSHIKAFFLPLLAAGFVLERQILYNKKNEMMQKVFQGLSAYSEELQQENVVNIDKQIKENLDWADSLMTAYKKEYEAFFDRKELEFQIKAKALCEKMKINRNNLIDMELVESMLQKRKKRVDYD